MSVCLVSLFAFSLSACLIFDIYDIQGVDQAHALPLPDTLALHVCLLRLPPPYTFALNVTVKQARALPPPGMKFVLCACSSVSLICLQCVSVSVEHVRICLQCVSVSVEHVRICLQCVRICRTCPYMSAPSGPHVPALCICRICLPYVPV